MAAWGLGGGQPMQGMMQACPLFLRKCKNLLQILRELHLFTIREMARRGAQIRGGRHLGLLRGQDI